MRCIMENDVLVSVITPCYNSAGTIAKTIESVLKQTYRNIEYIIVDGASTDNTMKIVKRYESEFEGRMKLISEKDQGIYDAMNKGIRNAHGLLIGIISSNDYYELDAIENIVQNISGEKYQILYGLLRTIKDEKEIMVYSKNHANLNNAMITHPTCFVSKQIYSDFGMYSLKYKYSSDYEFMLRMIRNKNVRFKEIYVIISNYSVDGVSSSVKGYRDTLRLKKEYGLISKGAYAIQMLKSGLSMVFRRGKM